MDPFQRTIAVAMHADYSCRCQQLAGQLGLALVDADASAADYNYLLIVDARGLSLQQTGPDAAGAIKVDFASGVAAHRRLRGGGELIVKAVGGSQQRRPLVLDATAGLGRDSFVLASWGCDVTLCERSPLVACLLQDGLSRAAAVSDQQLQGVIGRMRLEPVDAIHLLQQRRSTEPPDVVVIDPMFPPSKKSARVKKEMRAFQQLVGADVDSGPLLQAALDAATYRVVVKRPRKAPYLSAQKPGFSLEGKAIRFDIYTKKSFR